MGKKDQFVQKVALNAMLSTMAGASVLPGLHGLEPRTMVAEDMERSDEFHLGENLSTSSGASSITISDFESIEVWSPALEKEFRRLALAEAKRELDMEASNRLEFLTMHRNVIAFPRTVDEVLLQLRRDKIMDKLARTLEEYVEFKETAGETR